ncbi:hypothetical protein HPB48_022833 [Haemaphysalis longicornis]|uniref:Uncharacterized protein n=1 Tax=Haemaphysalis longicornis TaxID=44386 RepID=A0A9J6GAV5_HAELO|nr:hypothetical protein HPB48_022833 [Haemaphysalis longicornis]
MGRWCNGSVVEVGVAMRSVQDLMKLALDNSALWKARSELGADTKKVMEAWDPAEKNTLRFEARSFYLAYGKALPKTLPLANKVIKHAIFLALDYNCIEREVFSALPC